MINSLQPRTSVQILYNYQVLYMDPLDTPEYVLSNLTIVPNANRPGCNRVVTNVVLETVYPLMYPEMVARSVQYTSVYTEPVLIAIIA
jgi:hypothetical protein